MQHPIVLVGAGEMGGVFARGFLKTGHPVYPVTRRQSMEEMASDIPDPALVLVSVGEADLHPTLEQLPDAWRSRVGLLQNELLPRDWLAHDLESPTVVSVWFEKKRGQDYKVLVPSPLYGPGAPILQEALEALDIPCWTVADAKALEFELVRKNVYILTTNIAGLALPAGATVETLWNEHNAFARQVAADVMAIQAWLTGHEHDAEQLIAGMLEGIQGDLEHKCMGRSAPGRLSRALGHADEAGLAVPVLRDIHARHVA